MKNILYFVLFLSPTLIHAQGMWLPSLLEKQNQKEMKSLGCKLAADDIYHPVKPSLKDAICIFGGGCTGEMISPEGLLLTNHHCGFDAIQNLSTLEKNYVDNGYWAKNRAEELPAAGITATFVIRMEDVTIVALQGVTDGMNEKERQSQIDKNIMSIRANVKKEKWEETSVRPFYNGNQFYLYVTITYKDVRLVGAPPSSIGKFGSDTDNWVWPRHTGDFSIFRIYTDKDNQPAEYSATNIPYKPRHYFPISIKGIKEGDFTMVYGFPGRTDEYLSAAAVQQTADVLNPAKVAIRDKALKTLDGFMRQDPEIKISYIARYASIANAWKKWLGEMQGLRTYKALDKKNAYEADFLSRIEQKPDWKYRYANLLPRLRELHRDIEPYAFTRDYFFETGARNTQSMGLAANLHNWIKTIDENGEGFFASKLKEATAGLPDFYKEYRPEVDKAVFAQLMEMFAKNVRPEWGADFVKKEAAKFKGFAGLADHLYENSTLVNKDKMMPLLSEKPSNIAETLKKDPIYIFWKALQDNYNTNVQPKIQEMQPQINLLQRQYMAAQMAVFKEKRFFPDANSTLRLTYGKIRGYEPRDAVNYGFQTDLDGIMEKYIPGDYEFDVPQKLIDLWKTKNYGQYTNADGKVPVAFIGTNHTTGGNSGSPALDAKGNLVGLNFDRVWEGTMSDLNYDPTICRNIMVDARYILFIMDKFAGANHLLQEMKIVR